MFFLYVPLTSNNGTAAARRATENAIAKAGSSESGNLTPHPVVMKFNVTKFNVTKFKHLTLMNEINNNDECIHVGTERKFLRR